MTSEGVNNMGQDEVAHNAETVARPVYIEIEVEYVRKATILFTADPSEGMGQVGVPMAVGRVFRSLQYWMHTGKSLVRGETPRLLGWRIQSEHDFDCESVNDDSDSRSCQCGERLAQRAAESMAATKAARFDGYAPSPVQHNAPET